jgi:DNA-binding MarR family transcriptional regulator
MNYSDAELSTTRTNDEELVAAGVLLLPVISRSLFSAISDLGNAHGLTSAQVKVLLHLGTHRQMTVGEIASALSCSMPAASEIVDRLVDAGHLVRASDPTDRRRVLVAATPESERISSQLRGMREAQVRYALEQLPPEDRPTFIRSLEALVAGLTHANEAQVAECDSTSIDNNSLLLTAAHEIQAPATADQGNQDGRAAGDMALARSLRSIAR